MISFGANKVIYDQYMPTFKIQKQIYHRVGLLLLVTDTEHKFLQIYFMDDENVQIGQRCDTVSGTKCHIITSLQKIFN